VRHTVLGGQYRTLGGCFVGPLTIAQLDQFTLNIAFIGISGLDDAGAWVADLGESQVKLTAMNQARRVIVPMDSSKVGVSDFVRLGDLDRIDMIVTESRSEHLERVCAQHNVELRIVEG
jgi:DeoR/GlpR family transcriptional regulator of sugar metabolism